MLRGTVLGSALGILPGGGASLAAFGSYMMERKVSKGRHLFGTGAIEGVAGPEAANNAAAQTCFIPLLTLGIPANAVMALMVGALIIQGIQPGPRMVEAQPDLFWGLIASMWIGNVMLLVINLPMIGMWVKLLQVPYKFLYPAILVFCCIGVYSREQQRLRRLLDGDVRGVRLPLLNKLKMEPAPLLIGFVLGPMMEEHLRRAMLLSRGDPMVFLAAADQRHACWRSAPSPCRDAAAQPAQGQGAGDGRLTRRRDRSDLFPPRAAPVPAGAAFFCRLPPRPAAAMDIVEAVLALIAACIGFALLARRLRLPYAVILVLGGMALAFVPGLPRSCSTRSWRSPSSCRRCCRRAPCAPTGGPSARNLRPILLLAVGGVLFTALCIAVAAKLLVPDLPWAAAIALGAIVAPPDAVAAAAVLQRVRLPRRVVTVLEGESLVNDATALVLYRFAIAAVAAGGCRPGKACSSFVLVAAGGVALGWAAGWAAVWVVPRLDDTLLETSVSFLACLRAILAAEALHLSGVIAVVTTGIVLGQMQYRFVAPETRLAARAVWNFLEFVLNSLVFILIGLQLNAILDRLGDQSLGEIAGIAAVVSAALIVSRFVWVFSAACLPRLVPAVRRRDPPPPWARWR